MNKLLILVIFSISSLTMLSIIAVMPLPNIIPNVMAQGYDTYGDSSYSKYPTDDKKYECRTGPFEGFFVSSVEFCKFNKFDDKRKDISRDNNRTGTQGSPGPQGPQGVPGPIGPQGPSGNTQLNSTQLYIKENNVTITNDIRVSNQTGTAFLRIPCNPGDIAIDGQFTIPVDKVTVTLFSFTPGGVVPSSLLDFNINSVFQAGVSADLSAYEIGVYGSIGSVVAGHAICLDNSP